MATELFNVSRSRRTGTSCGLKIQAFQWKIQKLRAKGKRFSRKSTKLYSREKRLVPSSTAKLCDLKIKKQNIVTGYLQKLG